ncbi:MULTISPECIES: mannose-6-phosphate isomerase, class I [Mycobacteriaceae]|uniref:mannose-6-phosphate isomerase n=1 Tax=Mycolicibacterium neoaurum VKM Ac-1815D TaxID=700508 RepID=V5XAD5_MYCNE|nr:MULTISPECIES: mannose-6-phosphate isomerase, class I [Mycobacteriaceae]AHC24616.1 mannose-6-phosphate isomerase [Mycolicibacterium neoaurum VKM Ac-1815D]AMO05186.1 mannose-6-phosphate isomerase [Mycolicibacterium neoaurum]AXK76508.1 mannose-6-phosphate isomerase, class I [Mycolicibacterium neoaurum]KJQ49226.1 mannose-6-phosphate isomerase [Mycolicibacterium neoaurum]KUM08513.1 mannose-6-phosphate isomerase [Mycolicibacterium neoaurum]
MNLLRGAIRKYAWGSRTAIAEFTGRPSPTANPEAELWLGAHPGDPAHCATAAGERSLLEMITADPEGQLGSRARARFGDALPFLAKVLAADEPLSLQAHPSAQQAVQGFELENHLGIPVNAPTRNYRDRSHKPELIIALGTFEALAGFRPAARTAEFMRALEVPALDPFITLLTDQSDADGLRALFTTWITFPQPDLDVLVPSVLDGAINYLRSGATDFHAEAKTILELGERYPGDAGVLAAMLLNRITLAEGEAIYLPAGNLHAYLHGIGFEVMANSDNVLRGGLTPKHVDVPELLRVLDFTPTDDAPILPRLEHGGVELVYDTPATEFAVSVLQLDGDRLGVEVDVPADHEGPQILLCIDGTVRVHAEAHEDKGADDSNDNAKAVTLSRGASAWVAADDGPVRLSADEPARLFRVTVGI